MSYHGKIKKLFGGRQGFSGSAIRLLRQTRDLAYSFISPFDHVIRVVNGKSDLPPIRLRRYVGPLTSFEASGAEFAVYTKLLAGLRPNERVLDVGCGCGLMALYLRPYLSKEGSYMGVDIHPASIKWCQKHIASENSNFRFEQIDVFSSAYNPEGQISGENFRFPFEDGSFDVILMKSLFTHLRPAEVRNYMSEVARLLSAGGRALATFFLLNDEQQDLQEKGKAEIQFTHREGDWAYAFINSPESACAYDEQFILRLIDENRLTLRSAVNYGYWSGRSDGLSFQDVVVVEKR